MRLINWVDICSHTDIIVLEGDLGTINGGRSIFVKLWRFVEERVHVIHLFANWSQRAIGLSGILVKVQFMVFHNNVLGEATTWHGHRLSCTLDTSLEVSRWDHHLHLSNHGFCSVILLLLLGLHISWNSSIILALQLFIFDKSVGHDSWNLLKVLQHG